MALLASAYDQSRFLKAEDLPAEKKFRIKVVTEEEVGVGKDKERKLVVWFTRVVFPTMAEFRGTMKPALRVRIPPPKQAAGNGQAAAKPAPAIEPESPPPAAATVVDDDLNDDLNF
jgi:hypothetical protein